ncbi:unnamed protein product [Periconia digitata]|uniref:Uncharacterized protein n=1 Tax=Periconia digitata TaxID=1303443 RepID=A0A9W4XX30_9PLEO|nr:unnamed protein product [Periconia digitata]
MSARSKLEAHQYDKLTQDDVTLILRALAAYEHPKSRKERLAASYKAKGKREEIEKWHSNPGCFLKHEQSLEGSLIDNLIHIADWLDHSLASNRLAKRIVCLAMADLHVKGRSVSNILPQIQGSGGEQKKKGVATKFYEYLRVGNGWKEIILLCASAASSKNRDEATRFSYSGIIWLLGNGSMWERACTEERKEALNSLGDDFLAECEKYSPTVDKIRTNLKSINFYAYSPFDTPLKRHNQTGGAQTVRLEEDTQAFKRRKVAALSQNVAAIEHANPRDGSSQFNPTVQPSIVPTEHIGHLFPSAIEDNDFARLGGHQGRREDAQSQECA